MTRRVLKYAAITATIIVILVVSTGLWVYSRITGSLPQLDGEIVAAELSAPVVVERDALGIPTVRAENRDDLAFAIGFLHAQDRFFQMDLLRRNSAGELAELVGSAVLDHDRQVRVHRFRDLAQRVMAAGSDADRRQVEAYANGVNAGLASLRVKPFEYLLLGAMPVPWKPEDSALVMFSMYLDLQSSQYRNEAKRGLIHDLMGPEMLAFLCPKGTRWDAPIIGEAFNVPPIPGPEVFDTRKIEQDTIARLAPVDRVPEFGEIHVGSNNWAVAGTQTADGRALLADDMHLSIRVPHVWYRASLVWPDDDPKQQAPSDAAEATASDESADKPPAEAEAENESRPQQAQDESTSPARPADAEATAKDSAAEKPKHEHRVTGVTLPGTPAVVVGSNGRIAWGFTNSEGDWADLVIVEVDPDDKESYRTPDGQKKFEHHQETIKVKGATDETLDVVSTIWGPIVDHDQDDRPRALRWVAHDPEGVNMGLASMETVETLDEALQLANVSGSPAQNFMVADDQGHIAWTIIGRIPRRVGFDGQLPTSWADGSRRWDGYLEPEDYPRIVDPENGKLWTANARVVDGEMLAKLGDGGYDLGARAQQIRDDLLATDEATEADMLRIQLDDRAVFLEPWRELLLQTLSPEAVEKRPRRGELRDLVEKWGGRAATDSVGFRAVRAFRRVLVEQVSDVLVSPCKQVDREFSIARLDRTEGPVWRLVSERPEHMIDPRYKEWNERLLAAADAVLDEATKEGGNLADYTWGRYNTTKIQHPLSKAVPALADWLDMPPRALAGDSADMPRIQTPTSGASERLAVSPGHEDEGYLHMPCGQSGHPLSPHYRDALEAWEEGEPTPFLPGPTVHTLVLKPAA